MMRAVLRVLLPMIVLALASAGAYRLVKARKKPAKTQVAHKGVLVQVQPVRTTSERVIVYATGTVGAAETVTVRAEVAGRVMKMNERLVTGGVIKAGESLVELDSRDYALQVKERQAAVTKAEVDLKLEKSRRRIAEHEWELLSKEIAADPGGKALALRQPQIKQAMSALAGAVGSLQRAKLQVERTAIAAPINAIVKEESVAPGELITTQAQIATLVGTDEFWVTATVPMGQLSWIDVPGVGGKTEGSKAVVEQDLGSGPSLRRPGRVVRLLGDLDPVGRMARVLVAVQDPLALTEASRGQLPLLLGAFVSVEIEGHTIHGAAAVPRVALRDGDNVWLATAKDTLEVRPIRVAWRRNDAVIVTEGLKPGERIVMTRIPTPLAGMALRVESAPGEPKTPHAAGARSDQPPYAAPAPSNGARP